jgi:hypothetical protein
MGVEMAEEGNICVVASIKQQHEYCRLLPDYVRVMSLYGSIAIF